MSISHHNNDIILKYMSNAFKDTALDFYGLETPRIKAVVPTELPVIEVGDESMDFVFLLEDESYLHLEFQTTANPENLVRFMLYDARLYKKEQKQIQTAVIYSGVNQAGDRFCAGSIHYQVQNIYMNRFDGNAIYEDLKAKIKQHKPLERLDILNLIFLPLMRNKLDRNEVAINAAELAREIPDNEQKLFCLGSIIGISDKFINKDYVNRLKEVLRMTRFVAEIRKEAIEEGRQEGRQEGENNTKTKVAKKMLDDGMDISMIAQYTELSEDEIRKLQV